MSSNLIIISLIFIIITFLIITLFVRRNSITIKYSLIWYSSLFILFVFTIFPEILIWVSNIFSFQVASNLIFALIIGILLIVSISLTIIVSKQQKQIILLIQEISLIKSENNEEVNQQKNS